MNDNCAEISIFAPSFPKGGDRQVRKRKRFRLISKLMNLDNSSDRNNGISLTFSPSVWIYTHVYIQTRGVEPLFVYPDSGQSRAYQLDSCGYAPFCMSFWQ